MSLEDHCAFGDAVQFDLPVLPGEMFSKTSAACLAAPRTLVAKSRRIRVSNRYGAAQLRSFPPACEVLVEDSENALTTAL